MFFDLIENIQFSTVFLRYQTFVYFSGENYNRGLLRSKYLKKKSGNRNISRLPSFAPIPSVRINIWFRVSEIESHCEYRIVQYESRESTVRRHGRPLLTDRSTRIDVSQSSRVVLSRCFPSWYVSWRKTHVYTYSVRLLCRLITITLKASRREKGYRRSNFKRIHGYTMHRDMHNDNDNRFAAT